MKLIPLSKNSKNIAGKYSAMVDDKDFNWLNEYTWRARCRRGYDVRAIKHPTDSNKFLQMHRMIMGIVDPKVKVDHKDRNPLNNQRSNLRLCNPLESACNITSAKNSSSKYLGVSFSERRIRYKTKEGVEKIATSPAWRAKINKNYTQIHLGWFRSEKEAAMAYNEAAIKYHGDFANLNKF